MPLKFFNSWARTQYACVNYFTVEAFITWTLPSSQGGPLSNTDTSVQRTVQELDCGSPDQLHLAWEFTLSDESLICVSWKTHAHDTIGTKALSGAVILFPACQGQFDISPSDPATLIIYMLTVADGKKLTSTVTTDVRDWGDVISVVI